LNPLKTFELQLGKAVLAFYPAERYQKVEWKKGIHSFWNLLESFTPFCNSDGVLDLDVLSYKSSNQYKNMIATLENCGFTILNLEIGLKLSDKVRLEDVRQIYSHDNLNDKLTPKSQTQLLRV
jgi:hypothetical protein